MTSDAALNLPTQRTSRRAGLATVSTLPHLCRAINQSESRPPTFTRESAHEYDHDQRRHADYTRTGVAANRGVQPWLAPARMRSKIICSSWRPWIR